MSKGVKSFIDLSNNERDAIDSLLRRGTLSDGTKQKLIRLKELADPKVSVADSGMSRQTRHNWIRTYSDPRKRRALLENAKSESNFLANPSRAKKEFSQTPLSEIAAETKLSPYHLKKIAESLETEIPPQKDLFFTVPDFLNLSIRKSEKGAEGSKKLRPNIIDIGGLFYLDGQTLVAFAIYGSPATLDRFKKLSNEAGKDLRKPIWTSVATSDVLSACFFQKLHDLPAPRWSVYTPSFEKRIPKWKDKLKKAFPEKKWKIYYFVPPLLAKYFEPGSVIKCDKPSEYAERVARLAVDRIGTPGVFPTIREWLIKVLNIKGKGVIDFDLILGIQMEEPLVYVGSDQESFIAMRRIMVANFYWAAQGNVFYLEQPTSNVIRTRHSTLYKECELAPRYSVDSENIFDPEKKPDYYTVTAEIFPGQYVKLDADLGMDPKNLEKVVRKRINSSDALSRFYYDDGLEPPAHSRGLIGNTGHFSFSKDDQFPKDLKGKEGSSCRLMPRRFLFPDTTSRLQEISAAQEKSINFPVENNPEDTLIYDGSSTLSAIAHAFKNDYYSDVIITAVSWQTTSLRNIGNGYVSSWCLPDDIQYFSFAGDEIPTILGWLNQLPKTDASECMRIIHDKELQSKYHFSVALAQLWTLLPSFTCDISTEGKLELWTTNFRNLFIHLDADFLMSGLFPNFRQMAKSETVAWQEKVAQRLTHLQRRNKDSAQRYTDPQILTFENNLRYGKKQSDEVIEKIFSQTQDRILSYQSKVVRMALENCARQVLAQEPIVPVYVLPFSVLKAQFLLLAKKISKQEISKKISTEDTFSFEDFEEYDESKIDREEDRER